MNPLGLVECCRAQGLAVSVRASQRFVEAVDALGPRTPGDLYWAGRATLTTSPEDTPAYDDAFAAWLAANATSGSAAAARPAPAPAVLLPDADAGDDAAAERPPGRADGVVRFSADELLRAADLATLTPAERACAATLIDGIRVHRPARRSRRRRPTSRASGTLDLGRTVRHALHAGGEVARPLHTRPGTAPRRLVLLLDVSGSMEVYARALLRFAHAAARSGPGVEVFALGTRLTRLTRQLSIPDPDAALAAAADELPDWAGGTRLGATLRAFNADWGTRGAARGATVVILSDGWDRGDVELLGEQMARLRRLARRVVWVNPLKATEGYEPTAAGMAAALPHVDAFVPGHSVDALEALAEVVGR